MEHYESIPIGKENAISREELVELWGKDDRKVRRIIEQLRKNDNGDDYVLVSTAHQAGYYRTNDRCEIKAYKKEITRRGKHTFNPLRKVNRILADAEYQLSFTNNLKIARIQANLKSKEVIDELRKLDKRFDRSLLSKIENGLCMPTPMQLHVMSKLYDMPADELIGVSMMETL